jgi:hypothetical protein
MNMVKWFKISIIVLSIAVSVTVLYAEENRNEKSGNKYIFSYDQEIPTLIRYGDKVSGVVSKTGYIGFIQRDDGKSRSSIDFGYNLTYYELFPWPSMGRGYAIGGYGYIPVITEIAVPLLAIIGKERHVSMFSPLIGYSYSCQLLSWLKLGLSINTGPVYVYKITPWTIDNYNDDYEYEDYAAAYDAIGNISGKWGARINPKVKLYLLNFSDDTVHVGLGFGYVQYIFADNHFNSYDIGLDFTMAF